MDTTWLIFSAIDFVLAVLIAFFIGGNRKIGFVGSFLISIVFSAVIGLIVSLLSRKE